MQDLFSKTITLFNHRYSQENDQDEWHGTIIKGVSFFGGQKVTVSDAGLQSADLYKVRIPNSAMPQGFVLPENYASLPDTENAWTIQMGDIVVLGEHLSPIQKAAEITGNFHQHFVITSWSDNRRGVPMLSHIKIEGK